MRLLFCREKVVKKTDQQPSSWEEFMRRDLTVGLARSAFGAHQRPGRCFRCEKLVDESTNFRTTSALAKYKLSGLCQQCQDIEFAEEQEEY
jgi:hypothetical protein